MEKHPAPRLGTERDVIGLRFLAFVLDGFIAGFLTLVIMVPGFALGDTGVFLFGMIATAVSLVYAFLLEGMYGYTPGKYVVGLVVVKSDGSPCTIGASIIRNLLLIVDSLPFAYLIGIALILVTDRNQRVGDLVADTVVVKRR